MRPGQLSCGELFQDRPATIPKPKPKKRPRLNTRAAGLRQAVRLCRKNETAEPAHERAIGWNQALNHVGRMLERLARAEARRGGCNHDGSYLMKVSKRCSKCGEARRGGE